MRTVLLELGGNVGAVYVPEGFEEIGRAIHNYNDTRKSECSWHGPKDKFEREMLASCAKSCAEQRQTITQLLEVKPQFKDFASGVVFWFQT